MTDARSVILGRVRAANGGSTSLSAAQSDWQQITRGYTPVLPRSRAEIVELFEERLLDYDATVTRCSPATLTESLQRVLTVARVQRIGLPEGLTDLPLPGTGFQFVPDHGLSPLELDSLDAVLTDCTIAIAETGTLVLQSGPTQGRRALTLIPDTHICIVRTSDVVATVPEAFARLESTATLPTTFVSGPSATADIEMTRVKGVHGPRFLHILLLEDQTLAEDKQTET